MTEFDRVCDYIVTIETAGAKQELNPTIEERSL